MDRHARASIKGQRPCCIWLTGLPAAGKSTLSGLLEQRLHAAGRHTYVLDGDEIRRGLSSDLGFSDPDRRENNRRVAEVARLMVDAGLIVLCACISPFRSERRYARSLFREGEFMEVYVRTPIEVCMQRDFKGLYAQARLGVLKNVTGVDGPYEEPERPEVIIDTVRTPAPEAVQRVIARLEARGGR